MVVIHWEIAPNHNGRTSSHGVPPRRMYTRVARAAQARTTLTRVGPAPKADPTLKTMVGKIVSCYS